MKMSFAGDDGDNMLEVFEATVQGQDKLGLNGYVYHKSDDRATSGEWLCDYPSCPCLVTVDRRLKTAKFPAGKNEHIHPPDEIKVAEERVLKRIKEKLVPDIRKIVPEAKMWQVVNETTKEYKEDGGVEEVDTDAIYRRIIWWKVKAANELGVNHLKKQKPPTEVPEAKYPGDAGDNILERMMSNKGHHMITMNGYLYHILDKTLNSLSGEITWRCEVKHCPGRVKTDKAVLHAQTHGMHFHPPDHIKVELKRLDAMLNKHVTEGVEEGRTTTELLNSFIAGLPDETVAILPSRKALKNKCINIKKKIAK